MAWISHWAPLRVRSVDRPISLQEQKRRSRRPARQSRASSCESRFVAWPASRQQPRGRPCTREDPDSLRHVSDSIIANADRPRSIAPAFRGPDLSRSAVIRLITLGRRGLFPGAVVDQEPAAMRGKSWVYDPHSGGIKIPPPVRQRTEDRIKKHAQSKYAGKFTRLDIRFRGRSAISMPSQSRMSRPREFSKRPGKRESNSWNAFAIPLITSADSATSGTRIAGLSPFTLTATSGTSRACSMMGRSMAPPRKRSMSGRSTCMIDSDRLPVAPIDRACPFSPQNQRFAKEPHP